VTAHVIPAPTGYALVRDGAEVARLPSTATAGDLAAIVRQHFGRAILVMRAGRIVIEVRS
jgi:hypothetical protein